MDIDLGVVKLKPNSLPRVREWASELNKRMSEALDTLKDEGVHVESWFLLSQDDGDYLICYMRSGDKKKAVEAARKSLHEIDAYHQQFKKDTWESGKHAELLVDMVNPEAL